MMTEREAKRLALLTIVSSGKRGLYEATLDASNEDREKVYDAGNRILTMLERRAARLRSFGSGGT